MGGPERGHRANSYQRGNAVDAGTRASDENWSKAMIAPEAMTRTQRGTEDTEAVDVRRHRWRSACVSFVSFVTFVSFVRSAPVLAQMTGAPAAGFKREPGAPSSQLPRALREIGFDQHLDEHLPLDTPLRDEQGRGVSVG